MSVNGTKPPGGNGHYRADLEATFAALDISAERKAVEAQRELDAAIRPCCARIAHQTWCTLPDGHAGEHESVAAPMYGPLEERPRLWRDGKGMSAEVESTRSGAVGDLMVTIVKMKGKAPKGDGE